MERARTGLRALDRSKAFYVQLWLWSGWGGSNLLFHPIAKKLRIRQDEEELYCSTIIEGIIAIQSGENPKYLREHLLASLKQSQQKKLLSKAAKNAPEGGEGN